MKENLKAGDVSLRSKIMYMPLFIIFITFAAIGIVFSNMVVTEPKVLLIMFGILLFSFISLTLFLNRISQSIIRRLTRLHKAFAKQAEGDLTYDVFVTSRDELFYLAKAYNKTNSRLNEMINNISSHLSTLTSALSELSQNFQEITGNAITQSEMTAQSAIAMEELTASFHDVAQNTTSVAEFSKQADTHASEGGQVVAGTIDGMSRISQSVNEFSETIRTLGGRSEQIGDIINVINDIASQTNLLALNAAIEAARAGEQGRGFAVVADEVRKLAERTTVATHEIGDMIKGIQEDTGRAVESMEAGTKDVELGVSMANQAGGALNEIVKSIQQVSDMAYQISTAADEQLSTGENVSVSIDTVASISKETADAIQVSTESTKELDAMAHQLQQLVGDFTLRSGDSSEVKILELSDAENDQDRFSLAQGA